MDLTDMRRIRQERIRPKAVLYDIRRSVSEILHRPFSEKTDHQIFVPDKKILALWAADCAEHVLLYFDGHRPYDVRPRNAIAACRRWAETGVFRMADIRKASLDAHAAAGDAGEEDAVAAAHAAGQAVATAHVPTHALGSAVYAIRAAAAHAGNIDDGLVRERSWQLQRLREYAEGYGNGSGDGPSAYKK